MDEREFNASGHPWANPVLTDGNSCDFWHSRQVYGGFPNADIATERIIVDKRVQRVRFEGETETEVTIVIEPK